ncbi:MAG: NADH-quinone oxidoreductase subunit H, partial [Deltaproteobacteria bacterium]|nr:NADH-quinone oxidoreductase subunit H [Deltaproteobacteria bacterium]
MELVLDILSLPLVQVLIKIVLIVLVFVMGLGTVLTLLERKWMSAVQDRIGPNRANMGKFTVHGLFHILADGLKSIFKEDTVPRGADRFLFFIAPFFGFLPAVVVWAVIPFAAPVGGITFQITDINVGLVFIFAITSLGVYGAVLGGYASNNKYALLGAMRTSSQMLAYEVFVGISIMGLFMVYGSVQISQLVDGQNQYWFDGLIPKWGIFTQPLAFFLFFTAMLAEAKRLPFDQPEGESEIIAGYFLEYSGMRFSAYMLAEYISVVSISAIT